MPKRKLDINVRNPFSKKLSSLTPSVKRFDTSADGQEEPLCSSNNNIKSNEEPNFNLYTGTDRGILKGISLGGELPIAKSIWKSQEVFKEGKPPAVVSLGWADESEKELMVTLSNHVVKTYNTKLKCFTRQLELGIEQDAKVVGLSCHDERNYVFGLEDGTLGMWNCFEAEVALSFKTGDNMRKIRQCFVDRNLYASGGKENDLKIWNLSSEKPSEAIFKARNLPHDFLDLRIPVWIEDLTFLPRTTEVVVVGTRYGQIRLYDVRVQSRRPASNVQFVDHPIMSITATMNDRQVIVGTAKGEAGLYDLRNPGKEKLCLKYFGSAGSIRSVVASPDKPYFVSVGLDRHLYIHKFTERIPMKKLYLKQYMNCIALSKTFMADTKQNSENTTLNSPVDEDDWTNIPPDVLNVDHPEEVI